MALNLTEQNFAEMAEQGYTILPDVFTVAEMEELARTLEEHEARARQALIKRGGTEGINRADEITFTAYIAEEDPKVAAFARRPEFIELSTKFLKSADTQLYWNQTVFKHPEGTRPFPWHQDDAYTRVDPAPYLTLWLALNDATPENGCVSVMPGSHLKGFVEHQPSDIGLICHPTDDPNQGVQAPVKAGSIVAFWSLTMHKSGPNVSSGIRKAYILQYAPSNLRNLATNEPIVAMPIAKDGVAVAGE